MHKGVTMHRAAHQGHGRSRQHARRLAIAFALAITGTTSWVSLAGQEVAASSTPVPLGDGPTFAAHYLNGWSGVTPTRAVSLAGPWSFTPVQDTVCTGEASPTGALGSGPMDCHNSPAAEPPGIIQVPGGGWVKQGWTNVSIGTYERDISVPNVVAGQVTHLVFGAVNHRSTLWVDGHKVGRQTTSYTSQTYDISKFVVPGHTHHITVRVEGRRALVGDDGRYVVPEGASWSNDPAQGIFRSADLKIYPSVHIVDTIVHTSVRARTLTYDVVVRNAASHGATVTLGGRLASTNGRAWAYPHVPSIAVRIPARSTRRMTVGPLPWRAGAASYWWPNVPYRDGYRAQLHDLRVTLTSPDVASRTSRARVRFGFRETRQVGDHFTLNGRRVNFRGDSLQGVNYDYIDNFGRGDAYDTLPGFLKPSAGNGGWPQAVDNYLRLNFSGLRVHQLPATPYMLDVTDRMGLMVIDETAIRGSNNRENFIEGRANMINHLADLVHRDRNHASVLRWSQSNEPYVASFEDHAGAGKDFDEALYQTVMRLDTTRPISTDAAVDLPGMVLDHPNYTTFCHYDDGVIPSVYTESVCQATPGRPTGQTEFVWPNDNSMQGATWFGTATMRMREQGASDTRPYTMLDLWCGIIAGTSRTDMATEWLYPVGEKPLYGEDNLPHPWSNPTIKLLQLAFHPVAVIDHAFWNANKMSSATGAWPTVSSAVSPGVTTRRLTVFNDTFKGRRMTVSWRLREGSASATIVDRGMRRMLIDFGEHRSITVDLKVPSTQQQLVLELQVGKPGQGTLFHDSSTSYTVS